MTKSAKFERGGRELDRIEFSSILTFRARRHLMTERFESNDLRVHLKNEFG